MNTKMSEQQNYRHAGGKFRRQGPSTLTEAELLSILIGSGIRGNSSSLIASQLINHYGTIDRIAGVSLNELMKFKGIGPVKATQIAALFELTKRIIRHLERE
jgi:DNA repair protein RadC